jgi:hypothetical protein
MKRLVLLLVLCACEETPNLAQVMDSGVVRDAGDEPLGALPIQVGDQFTYRGTLTRREGGGATDETQSQYRITVVVTDVVDRGDEGPSEVSYTMSQDDAFPADGRWSLSDDRDSWVGRLGPSIDTDVVSTEEATLTLVGAPTPPPAPGAVNPKTLPPAALFFVDLRFVDDLVADWLAAQDGQSPTANPQGGFGAALILESNGADPDVARHQGSQQRRVSLRYDENGVLLRLSEDIGFFADDAAFPDTTAELDREDS